MTSDRGSGQSLRSHPRHPARWRHCHPSDGPCGPGTSAAHRSHAGSGGAFPSGRRRSGGPSHRPGPTLPDVRYPLRPLPVARCQLPGFPLPATSGPAADVSSMRDRTSGDKRRRANIPVSRDGPLVPPTWVLMPLIAVPIPPPVPPVLIPAWREGLMWRARQLDGTRSSAHTADNKASPAHVVEDSDE